MAQNNRWPLPGLFRVSSPLHLLLRSFSGSLPLWFASGNGDCHPGLRLLARNTKKSHVLDCASGLTHDVLEKLVSLLNTHSQEARFPRTEELGE